MITEQQIHHLATSTPLSYDGIAALAYRAERYGMSNEAFVVLVECACKVPMDNGMTYRFIAAAIDVERAWQMVKKRSKGNE